MICTISFSEPTIWNDRMKTYLFHTVGGFGGEYDVYVGY